MDRGPFREQAGAKRLRVDLNRTTKAYVGNERRRTLAYSLNGRPLSGDVLVYFDRRHWAQESLSLNDKPAAAFPLTGDRLASKLLYFRRFC